MSNPIIKKFCSQIKLLKDIAFYKGISYGLSEKFRELQTLNPDKTFLTLSIKFDLYYNTIIQFIIHE